MLAGLLFANLDAEDRSDRLIATSLFAGSTLIEHQARQLVAAGASQLIVVASGLPPELLGALSRIGRKNVAVDAVRSAGEAAEKLHPLARVLVLADGLVATDEAVRVLSREGGDALLVVPSEPIASEFERVGGMMAWAGVARVQPQRLVEVAQLPRDYDMQSALIRVAEQAGATHVSLAGEQLRQGHGFARTERQLEERGRRVLAAFFAGRRNWFERWIVAPVAGLTLPLLVERGVSATMLGIGMGMAAFLSAAALVSGHSAAGALTAFSATLAAVIGTALAGLRGEARAARGHRLAAIILPLVVFVMLGWVRREEALDDGPLVAALCLVMLAVLAERTVVARDRWWGSPAAYLLLIAIAALVGVPGWGIGLAAIWAAATLTAGIEELRGHA